MFTAKQKSLFGTTQLTSGTSTMSVSENPYLRKGLKKAAKITNPQGSIKLKTSGSDFVDDFAKVTNYKSPRSFDEINSTVSIQWSQNPLLTMCMIFYIRMITRVVQLFNGTKTTETQRGQGLKHEGIFRMMWVALNAPDTFWKNIGLLFLLDRGKILLQCFHMISNLMVGKIEN
jgi:hypothetical protein